MVTKNTTYIVRKLRKDTNAQKMFSKIRAERGNGTPMPLRKFAHLCAVSHNTIAVAEKGYITDDVLLRMAIKSADVEIKDLAITLLRRRYPSLINPRPTGEKTWLEEKEYEKEIANKS